MSCQPDKYQLGKICNPASNRWVNATSKTGHSLRLTQDAWLSSLNTDIYMFLRPFFIKYFKISIPKENQSKICISDLNMFIRPTNFLYQNYTILIISNDLKSEVTTIIKNLLTYLNEKVENNILKIIFHNHGNYVDINQPLPFTNNNHKVLLGNILIADILLMDLDPSQIITINEIPYLNFLSPDFVSIYHKLIQELPKLPNNCSYLTQFINPVSYNFNDKYVTLPVDKQKAIAGGVATCVSDIIYGSGSTNNFFGLRNVKALTILRQLPVKKYDLIHSYTKHSKTLNINLINYYETGQDIFLKSLIYDENITNQEYMSYQHPLTYKSVDGFTLYDGLNVAQIYLALNNVIDTVSTTLYRGQDKVQGEYVYVYEEDYFYIYSIRNFVGIMNGNYIFNPNFVSCTYRPDVVIDWLISSGQMCCLFVIRVKKGDNFLFIGAGLHNLFYGDESEVLLKAGSFFKITNVVVKNIYSDRINDFLVYYVDYIDHPSEIAKDNLYELFEVPTTLQWTSKS